MKHINFCVALSAILLTTAAASATTVKKPHTYYSNSIPRLYLGVEYGHNFTKPTGFSSNRYHSIIPNLGVRGEHFGFEAGYLRSCTQSTALRYPLNQRIIGKAKTHMDGFHVDGHVYAPLAPQLEAIGSLGVGAYKEHYKASYQSSLGKSVYRTGKTSSKAALRLGVGLQFNADKNLSLRAMVRHIDNGVKWRMGEGWMGTVGMNFIF